MITIQRLLEELEREREMRRTELSYHEYLMDFSGSIRDADKKAINYWKTRALQAEEDRLKALYPVT